jgi:hypothetical protein
MSDYDYVNEQLQQITPVDEYGIQIKLTSTTGETKWMNLTKENQQEYLSKIVPAIQKALGFETGSLDSLSRLVDEMTQVILDKLGADMNVKPIRIIHEMRQQIKLLEGGVQHA